MSSEVSVHARREEERAWLAAQQILAGRAALLRVAATLAPLGIVPLVLKGVLLSAIAESSERAPRPMSDLDVLVPKPRHDEAMHALLAAGLERRALTHRAVTLLDREHGIDVDLHSELLEPHLFRLDARAMLARTTRDETLFGVAVLRPHPVDLYAHLVGHFVNSRADARDRRHLADFELCSTLLALDADEVAARLDELGLARAARYVLGLASRRGDTFAARVTEALPPDAIGAWTARTAERWLARAAGNDLAAAPVPHLLNHSLAAGAVSLGSHVKRALAWRGRAMLERALHRGHVDAL